MPELSEKIRLITHYFYITPLFIGNKIIFLLIYNTILLIIYISVILLFVIYSNDISKIKYYNLYVNYFVFFIPLICFTFYGQILGLLVSVCICNFSDNTSIINNYFERSNGFWSYIEKILNIFSICFLTYFSYISVSVSFRPNFIIEGNDILKKTSTIPDKILFVNKIIYNIIFNIIREEESYQWFILSVLFIFTFINVFCTSYYNSYENIILMKEYKGLSLILFWSICSLIIGKIFQSWEFNGTLHLFLLGSILIIIFFIYHKGKVDEFYTLDFRQIDSSKESLKYIKNLLELIKNKDKSRQKFIAFYSLIILREEKCINNNCKIKKYLKMRGKGYQSDYILYQYCQQLFEISIKKFPNDIILKANYIIYLLVQMNKKKLAKEQLLLMQKKFLNFQNNFIIFCCEKFIKKYEKDANKNFEVYNKNTINITEYEKTYVSFKNYLLKTSILFYEFWSILYKSILKRSEDFIKIDAICDKINTQMNKIDDIFQKLSNSKSEDLRILGLYSGFLKNILNNKEKYNDIKRIFASLSSMDLIKDRKVDYSNFNLNILNTSDEYNYFIISAEEDNLGVILNISLNLCQILGYEKNEIIGKNIDILFPEIYQKQFKQFLVQYRSISIAHFYEMLYDKKKYSPEFIKMIIDVKIKSKHLITMILKLFFIQTEDSEQVFIMEFLYEECIAFIKNRLNEYFHLKNSINSLEANAYDYSCVLTDYDFNIQIFTSNCKEFLGLTYDALNSKIDITKYIEQFNEEIDKIMHEDNMEKQNYNSKKKISLKSIDSNISYLQNINSDSNYNTFDNNLMYKRYIVENKFSELRLINWKIYDLIQSLDGNQVNKANCGKNDLSYNDKRNKGNNYSYNNCFNVNNIYYGDSEKRLFFLVVKKAILNGEHVGYKFFFKRKKHDEELQSEKNKNNYFEFKEKKSTIKFKSNGINNNEINKNSEENINTYPIEINRNIINDSKSLNIKKKEEKKNSIIFTEKSDNNDMEIKRVNTIPLKANIKKVSSEIFSDIQINNNTKKGIVIEQNYIPKCNFSFKLDLDCMSYRPIYNKYQSRKTLIALKNQAFEKINKYKTIEDNLKNHKLKYYSYSSSSSFEESESYENEDDEELKSSSFSNSPTDKRQNKSNKSSRNEKEMQNHIEQNNRYDEIKDSYYKVSGLNKIKYMEYDFGSEMIVYKGIKNDNKSEVENIFMNYKLKIQKSMDKETDIQFLIFKKLLSKNSKILKREKLHINNENNINNELKKNENIDKKKEIYKKIENALNKNDKEIIVIRFLIYTILSSVILLIISIFSLFFITTSLKEFKNNLFLIIYSTNIRFNSNIGVYYIREITVVSFNNSDNMYIYYPIIKDRATYLEELNNNIKNVLFEGHENMELMMGTNLDLNKNNSYHLYTKPFIVRINDNSYINISLYSSVVQIYTNFYHLITSEDFKNNCTKSYIFIENVLNNLALGLEEIIAIYFEELLIRRDKYITLSLIILVVIFIIYIGIFFFINITYDKIIERKDSYISLFYGIKLSLINASMIRCERFINQINSNEKKNAQDIDDNTEDSIESSNFKDEVPVNETSRKNNNNKNNTLNIKFRKEYIFKFISKNRIFMIELILTLLLFYLGIFFIFIRFIASIKNIEVMGKYIYSMQHFHNIILNIFNSYREFIFFKNSQMFNKPVLDFIIEAEREMYDRFDIDIGYLLVKCVEIDGLSTIFTQLQKNQVCNDNKKDEISNIELCDNYMKIVSSLGFYNFEFFWVEEIRNKKNLAIMNDQKNIESDNVNKEFNYYSNRAIEYFNDLDIHSDINYLFIFAILPFIDEERHLTLEKIILAMNSKYKIYILFLIIYLFVKLVIYILYWRIIVDNIKNLIYKAKKVLKMIPVEILASQTNIKSLINILDLKGKNSEF